MNGLSALAQSIHEITSMVCGFRFAFAFALTNKWFLYIDDAFELEPTKTKVKPTTNWPCKVRRINCMGCFFESSAKLLLDSEISCNPAKNKSSGDAS